METKIKQWMFCFVFAILVLPLAEFKLHFIKSGALKGGFMPASDSPFSLHSWLAGTFQRQKERYLNDETGFRPDMVRLNNQIDFTFFDKCHAAWTVKGKNHYLFQYPYINAYFGLDFQGYVNIRNRAWKLKAIQDTLSKLGKTLILAYLPSKANYYPEYFPAKWDNQARGLTNYEVYKRIGDSIGTNQVDLNAWFVAMKGKSQEPLFSLQGIHWTNYGAILGGDSLIRYIEKLRHIQVQHPVWSEMERTSKLRDGDDDVASELNLIYPVAKETLTYPIIKDVPDTQKAKINAIYIGDSYAHKMIEFGIVYKMNGQCEFWRYFDEMHDINGHNFTYINSYNWIGAIDKADCVVLAYTLFNLTDLGNGFIEKAYDHYYPYIR